MPKEPIKNQKKSIPVVAVSVAAIQLMLFLLHAMIYETIVAAFGPASAPVAIIIVLLSLTFVSSSLLVFAMDTMFTRAYYRFAGTWFAFVAPLCAASLAFVVIENIFPLWGWILVPVTAGGIVFGGAAAIALYGIWNGLHVRVTRVAASLSGLPDAWRDRRLVFFSDVHLGPLRGAGLSRKIVKKVQAQDPSVIAIVGDLFDGTKCDAKKFAAPLKDLRAPDGVYFVSGNHEYVRDSDVFFSVVREAGMKILRNEKVTIGGVDLLGVDWRDTRERKDFAEVMKAFAITKDRPSILLRHVPMDLDIAERAGVSVQLSGHTHRGQFWPLSLATKYFYRGFDYGLRRFEGMTVYTSSGVGTWMSPFRFGTKAEIVVMEFK